MTENDDTILISLKLKKSMLNDWDEFCKDKAIKRSRFIRDSVNKAIKQQEGSIVDEVVKFYITGLETRMRTGFQRIEALLRANLEEK